MTDQLFATGPSLPPLCPAERLGRWVLHRAGIVNVWEYDRTELSFAGGRVLLAAATVQGSRKLWKSCCRFYWMAIPEPSTRPGVTGPLSTGS